MRNTAFKIVNESQYHATVIDIDVSGLTSIGVDGSGDIRFKGDLSVETIEDNGWIDISGYHGSLDYVNDYGVELVSI